jgi:hypothetical protein
MGGRSTEQNSSKQMIQEKGITDMEATLDRSFSIFLVPLLSTMLSLSLFLSIQSQSKARVGQGNQAATTTFRDTREENEVDQSPLELSRVSFRLFFHFPYVCVGSSCYCSVVTFSVIIEPKSRPVEWREVPLNINNLQICRFKCWIVTFDFQDRISVRIIRETQI